jgi:radical SAM superfamily enzyme YgiQ (UPF0313 family)
MRRGDATAGGSRLHEAGRILLLSCYELGHAPHGLAMPLAFLEQAGFDPAAIDLAVSPLDDEAVDRAELAIISVPMHTALRLGLRVIEEIRARNPRCRIACIGLYAPLNEGELRRAGVEFVFAGEHEPALVALAEALDAGRPPPAAPPIQLAKLPFPRPSRTKLPPLRRYAALMRADGDRVVAGYAETTRGCLDTCRHCPVPAVYGGRFFAVARAQVLADIEAQVEAGARHITFGDPDFLNGPGHGMTIVRALAERFPGTSFDITAQITHLRRHRALLPELAELGCAFVVSAVESLSDEVLARLKKQHRRADVFEALEHCELAGLIIRPTFVPFTPWTTLADLRELVDTIERLGLVDQVDPVQLSIRLLVPPGSLLLEAPDTRDAFGPLDPAAFSHRWDHPDPRVDALAPRIAKVAADQADAGGDAAETHAAIRALVYRASGREPPAPAPTRRRRVARLTESWFCCSEPTAGQLADVINAGRSAV